MFTVFAARSSLFTVLAAAAVTSGGHAAAFALAGAFIRVLHEGLVRLSAGKEVTIIGGTEEILSTRHPPAVAKGCLDRHVLHLPCVGHLVIRVEQSMRVAVSTGGALNRVPAEQASVRLTFVEARFHHEETLACGGDRAAAIPMEFFSITLLQAFGSLHSVSQAAGVFRPRVTLLKVGWLLAGVVIVGNGVFRVTGRLMIVLKMALIYGKSSDSIEETLGDQVLGHLVVWIFLVEIPHGISILFVFLVFESAVPHVFADLLATGIYVLEFLTLWQCLRFG